MAKHDPVMVNEILEELALSPGDLVVDCTLGLGGHSLRFISAVKPGGAVVGMDWDRGMLEVAKERLGNPAGVNLEFHNADFRSIGQVMNGRKAAGILMDLGLNSAQVDDPERGISFLQDGPLDMRMDRDSGEPAASLLNRLSLNQISQLLREYGDERWAVAIARKVIERRKSAPLRTTSDLVDCVLAAIPAGARDKRIHPATRTFQAVRIAVNGELTGLDEALEDAAECLAVGGTLAVLSYHSGEDRIVKHAFRQLAEQGFKEGFKKPKTPSSAEIEANPRSRSAKLRILRRPT